ncbi:hypothetical protein ED208_03100 [Stagnimonas aquatica]|uniref:Uncharacterized protein n=1 Tax=Stagnimonas aquatica TaxID=2689987 RepID=A0A3N0VLD8_9GAMM|nr:hypothetical protein ED208_03100 [Stagnimonas aquatica]
MSTFLLGILAAAILGGGVWDYQTREQARLRLRVLAAQLEPLGQLQYQELRAHPWGQGSVEQLRFLPSPDTARRLRLPAGAELRVDALEVDRYRESGDGIPEKFEARLRGLHWPASTTVTSGPEVGDPAEQPLPSLGELGYQELRFDGRLRLQYLRDAGALQLAFALRDPSAARLDGELSLFAEPAVFRGEWQSLTLSQLRLDYRDLGLLARLKPLLALRARVSNEGLDAALVTRLERETRQRGLRWPAEDYAALVGFLREARGLRIRMDPPGELRLRDLPLYAEADLPQVLGLELRPPPVGATTPP